MSIFKRRNKGSEKLKTFLGKEVKFVELNCFQCKKAIMVTKGRIAPIFFTGSISIERAKASGVNGYCEKCQRAFCSEHSGWSEYSSWGGYAGCICIPYCPICNIELGGYN